MEHRIVLLLSLFVLGCQARIWQECDKACASCQNLSVFMETKSCPNCDCLNDLSKVISSEGCKKNVDRSIYCPSGFEIDYNGCTTGVCNKLDCDWSILSKCKPKCTMGYLVDPDGCPTCECQCDSEGKSIEEFSEICRKRCPQNDEIILEEDKTGCLTCVCKTTGVQATHCEGRDLTLECPKSCGKWPRRGGCSANRCDCRCPMRGLTCKNVDCPFGQVPKLIKDEFGCEITCQCDFENKVTPSENPRVKCSNDVTCPANCGPYEMVKTWDKNGCISSCRCKCMNPKCAIPCVNGYKLDIYGCPTCECLPKLQPGCLGACNVTCGPYPYKRSVIDKFSTCRSNCECKCPSPVCPEFCSNVDFKPNRYGCLECHCKNVRCPKVDCLNKCGPHGPVLRWDGCPSETCECRCPKLQCPICPNGETEYYLDGYGCPSCQCKCPTPPPTDCRPCPNGYKVNKFGCQETCECAPVQCRKLDCSAVDCPSQLFAEDKNGCETCNCCPIEVSKCPTKCRLYKSDDQGCPTCECI